MMRLSELASQLKGRLLGGDCEFSQLSTDSRNILDEGLFLALRGEHFDGHEFVASAAAQGACGVVVDIEQENLNIPQLIVDDTLLALGLIAACKRRAFSGRVIAVTGSSGKTTVKGMLASILSQQAPTLSTQGNYNNQIGVPLTLMQMEEQKFAVVELGTSHPGEIEYLTNLIDPDIALVTNVLPAHIGGFGSLRAIAAEKSQVYLAKHASALVINADEPFAGFFAEQSSAKQLIYFSIDEENTGQPVTLFAKNITWNEDAKVEFDICYQQSQVHVTLSVPGIHNVSNAIAAASCAIACGVGLDIITQGLECYIGDKGRMQAKSGMNGSLVIDDSYNANPGSVRAAIDTLSLFDGKKILVLGEMGELGSDSDRYHKEIGLYATEKGLDCIYSCGAPANLAAQIFGVDGYSFVDKNSLVEDLKKQLHTHVTVLVKGSRSAKMEDVVGLICTQSEVLAC